MWGAALDAGPLRCLGEAGMSQIAAVAVGENEIRYTVRLRLFEDGDRRD
jgi:hypothetical protein